MRIKLVFRIFVLTAVAAAVFPAQDKAVPANNKAGSVIPLIRMDLLKGKDRPSAAVKRDIFIPESASVPIGGPVGTIMMGERPPLPAAAETAAGPPPEATLNARYLGYIRGTTRLTALVLFENRAMALEEGEMLDTVWKVVKVTIEEIEIQGADGSPRTLALEGERK